MPDKETDRIAMLLEEIENVADWQRDRRENEELTARDGFNAMIARLDSLPQAQREAVKYLFHHKLNDLLAEFELVTIRLMIRRQLNASLTSGERKALESHAATGFEELRERYLYTR